MTGEKCPFGCTECSDKCVLFEDGKTCLERILDAMRPKPVQHKPK